MGFTNLLGLVVGLGVWLLVSAPLINYLREPYRSVDESLRPHWVAATIFTVACMAVVVAWIAVLVGLVMFFTGHPGQAAGILGIAIFALVALELYDGRTTATASKLRKRLSGLRSRAHR